MLNNMKLAAPAADEVLVQLLTRWAAAGRQKDPHAVQPTPQPLIDDDVAMRADSPALPGSPSVLETAQRPSKRARLQHSPAPEHSVSEDMVRTSAMSSWTPCAVQLEPLVMICTISTDLTKMGCIQAERVEVGMLTSTAETGSRTRYNPIDHIFQFHKALKRDLTALEESAQRFNAAVHENGSIPEAAPVSCSSASAARRLRVRPIRHMTCIDPRSIAANTN